MDAVLPVDKPAGRTSRQVTGLVAGLAGTRKAGHAGTLDPLATGVLLVCVGRATLLTSYLGSGTRRYRVRALLGVETDTYDIDGSVTATADASGVDAAAVREAAGGLTGRTVQVPPPFSAVRRGGRRLYEYARRGLEPPRVERDITVDAIVVEGLGRGARGPEAVLDVTCGPGTYVRSLVRDIGRSLGCGATVAALRRVRSGEFLVKDCVTLACLEGSGIEGHALSLEDATAWMPTLRAPEDTALAVSMGKPLPAGIEGAEHLDGVFRVLDPRGRLIALYGPAREGDEDWIAARALRVLRPHNSGENDEAA